MEFALESNPVLDFLKFAERRTQVRAHTRKTQGKVISVAQHDREATDSDTAVGGTVNGYEHPELQLDTKKARELELWRAWKEGGENPRDLEPLLRSFRPLLRSKMNVYKGKIKMIPDAAIEAEFQLRFVDALRSYNPEKGSLGTYVYRYLDKAKRFIVENQNIGRIPENRVYKIKAYTTARDELSDDLGRVPSVSEVAERLGWSEAESQRMDAELRNDLMTQGFEDDPYSITPSKSEEVLRLFKYELAGDERDVYEHLTGFGKKQLTSTSEIAKQLGMPDYRVSRLKNSIQKKLKGYLHD
jgi:DNA-directed RNA polymerase specialized sigma subunit